MTQYLDESERILVFDKYNVVYPKVHERHCHAGDSTSDNNLNLDTPLPNRDTVMKNKNRRQLSKITTRCLH